MADSVTFETILGGTVHRNLANESIQERYRCEYDSVPTLVTDAYNRAVTAGLPSRATYYTGTSLFFESANYSIAPENRQVWYWDVTWTPLPPGKNRYSYNLHPLDRPAEFDLQRRETDFPIVKAQNVEALARADGGSSRAAFTEGRIVNAAGEQPDEQPLDTVSNPVLVIRKNVYTLQEIIDINAGYQLSTNNATVNGWSERRLKFLAAESQGRREENGTVFYPMEIRIEVMPTTDLELDNVGYSHWKDNNGTYELTRAKVKDGEGNEVDSAAPVNLKLDGTEGTDTTPTSIKWRYLTPMNYAPLFNDPQP